MPPTHHRSRRRSSTYHTHKAPIPASVEKRRFSRADTKGGGEGNGTIREFRFVVRPRSATTTANRHNFYPTRGSTSTAAHESALRELGIHCSRGRNDQSLEHFSLYTVHTRNTLRETRGGASGIIEDSTRWNSSRIHPQRGRRQVGPSGAYGPHRERAQRRRSIRRDGRTGIGAPGTIDADTE